MSLKNFQGKTFVAFADISGFKKKVEENIDTAEKILSDYFNIGYNLLLKYKNSVSGIFISDSAILYIHDKTKTSTKLNKLLNVIKELNIECIKKNIMLTTSIAYGDFRYKKKHEENANIQKGCLVGKAYLNAFFDSEGSEKNKVLQCRIVKNKDTTEEVREEINTYLKSNDNKCNYAEKNNHFYYYWQMKKKDNNSDYLKTYNDLIKEIDYIKSELKKENDESRKKELKNKINKKYDEICEKTKKIIQEENNDN